MVAIHDGTHTPTDRSGAFNGELRVRVPPLRSSRPGRPRRLATGFLLKPLAFLMQFNIFLLFHPLISDVGPPRVKRLPTSCFRVEKWRNGTRSSWTTRQVHVRWTWTTPAQPRTNLFGGSDHHRRQLLDSPAKRASQAEPRRGQLSRRNLTTPVWRRATWIPNVLGYTGGNPCSDNRFETVMD